MMSEGKLVAIVDDNHRVLDAMKGLLESMEYEVIPFSDAADFLAAMDDRPFGCVITDVQLPGINGLELLKHIHYRAPATPVVLMTGFPSEFARDHAIAGGALAYLAKPIRAARLQALLSAAFSKSV